jgi:hypothetical protein
MEGREEKPDCTQVRNKDKHAGCAQRVERYISLAGSEVNAVCAIQRQVTDDSMALEWHSTICNQPCRQLDAHATHSGCEPRTPLLSDYSHKTQHGMQLHR